MKKELLRTISRLQDLTLSLDREKDRYALSVIYNTLASLFVVLDLELDPDQFD